MGDQARATSEHADKDGHFRRKDSVFRDFISKDPNAKFPAEKGRYALYVNLGCPWAHRTILVRVLKNLEDIIQIILTDFDLTENGWLFTGRNGSADRDPLYGFAGLKQLYLKANPDYVGRYTVPTLWDKKLETIVNNESSEVIRMLYTEFDDLIDPMYRESTKGTAGLYPPHLRDEIDDMNDWVYNTINNGVYKCGFATSQEAYDANVYPLFASLDRVEQHLANPIACHGGPFLFGPNLTEADIRLYTTIARFDAAYHTIFQCNLKSIRTDYPRIYRWLRRIYWNASDIPKGRVFKDTTIPDVYRFGYARARQRQVLGKSVPDSAIVAPRGPLIVLEPWTEDDEAIDRGRLIAYSQAGDRTPTAAVSKMSLNGPSNGSARPADAAVTSSGKIDLTSSLRSPTTTHSPSYGSYVAPALDTDSAAEPSPRQTLQRRTTYQEENEKWYKAARKAEKKKGAPNVHLAL